MTDITDDERKFGRDRWVYCSQHVRPHTTGWCTVSVNDKVPLDAKDRETAFAEARSKGFRIFFDYYGSSCT